MKMIIQRKEYERLREVERQFLEQMSLIELLNGSVLALKSQIAAAHASLRTVCDQSRAAGSRTSEAE